MYCLQGMATCLLLYGKHNILQNSSQVFHIICLNRCGLRLVPFNSIDDSALFNEIFCIPVYALDSNAVDNNTAMQPKLPAVSNLNKNVDNECAIVRLML